jgi:hypothetical protein
MKKKIAMTTLPNNPYIFLEQNKVSINCGNENLNIDLDSINKIHITKRKSGYFENFMGQLLRIPETHYNLNIQTRDKGWLKIRINPLERFFCIKLVSVLRPRLKTLA